MSRKYARPLSLSLGDEKVEELKMLTELSAYERPVQFLRALIARLNEIVIEPFDVRDLTLKIS